MYFAWRRFITNTIFRRSLRACGVRTAVMPQVFWTPEFISIGSGVMIWAQGRIEGISEYSGDKTYSPHIEIGDNCNIQQRCHITAAGNLKIGRQTAISAGVTITDIHHRYEDDRNILDQAIEVRSTEIGENCFIGVGAVILPGVKLGNHCIVGANSVVKPGSYPDNSVLTGNPAVIVKSLTQNADV